MSRRADNGSLIELILDRQNTAPKRLHPPGPGPAQLHAIFQAAAAAPDHGRICPWRFVVVPLEKRVLLAEAFARALSDRDPSASPDQLATAREKAYRAPVLILAIARLGTATPEIPHVERLISLGCALQNMLLCAQALGFGSGVTSGQAMNSAALRELFGLSETESAACFVNVGTVSEVRPPRRRPVPADFVSELQVDDRPAV